MAQPTNGKIYITISDERKGVSPDSPRPDEPENEEETKKKSLGDYLLHKTLDFLRKELTEVSEYAIQNIGNFSGNYAAQRELSQTYQAVSSLVDMGLTIALSPNPVVAVAAVGFKLISTGINDARRWLENTHDYNKSIYGIDQLRTRSGMNSLMDGSRGTMD